jgi:hypothetical protein
MRKLLFLLVAFFSANDAYAAGQTLRGVDAIINSAGGTFNTPASTPTASRACVFDGSSVISASSVTSSELAFLSGVTSSVQTQLTGKEPSITIGTSAQYWRGDKTMQTLNTAAVPESGSLYFTNARAIAAPITGFTSGAGALSATDTLLQSIQKLDGNVAATVPETRGGTNQTSYTLGDTLYSSATNTLSKLAGNTTATKKFLTQTGTGTVSAAPSWLQPACADLSNASASCSTDATNASNISTGTLAAGRLPLPSATTLGGIESFAAVTHQWINSISTSGVPSAAQPACSDLSNAAASCSTDATNATNISTGTLPAGRLPVPSATTLGGVQSAAAVSNQWIDSISTSGVPHLSQPAFSNLSGNITTSQMNSGTGASSTTFWRGDGTWATTPGGASLSTFTVTFNGTDTGVRTTVSDAAATATSKIVLTIRQPDSVSSEDQKGYIYEANIVKQATGSFDVYVVAMSPDGDPIDEEMPSDTLTVIYQIQ